ncbi:hypothetical protein DPMN_056785 [Dreissena polymorpha]|uniref:Uncharacterized protein n=1 Tax=Dreissena polymorpha TaxID=45954 RepID=A0A9D4CSC2_DREPO|nr:hypothetical protein DPMN_056785 [Dreissena polymorpha]
MTEKGKATPASSQESKPLRYKRKHLSLDIVLLTRQDTKSCGQRATFRRGPSSQWCPSGFGIRTSIVPNLHQWPT